MNKVKLISYTKPAEETSLSDDLLQLVSFCARVSNPGNQYNEKTAEKLVKYLMKHKHWSPFEMVNVCLEIETTRDISRQILRHRSFSFQEFSQRDADPVERGVRQRGVRGQRVEGGVGAAADSDSVHVRPRGLRRARASCARPTTRA